MHDTCKKPRGQKRRRGCLRLSSRAAKPACRICGSGRSVAQLAQPAASGFCWQWCDVTRRKFCCYNKNMDIPIDYDPNKDAVNTYKHGVSLALAQFFEWGMAQIEEDIRFDYGERRFKATGYIGQRLYVMVFCPRGEVARVISLRKANPREEKRYAET